MNGKADTMNRIYLLSNDKLIGKRAIASTLNYWGKSCLHRVYFLVKKSGGSDHFVLNQKALNKV